jgi:hypothetical protein
MWVNFCGFFFKIFPIYLWKEIGYSVFVVSALTELIYIYIFVGVTISSKNDIHLSYSFYIDGNNVVEVSFLNMNPYRVISIEC